MPYLGDYLGHLLSEVATARVQADLETVRVAELYASHPLLRHLPVPRFRVPTLTLDVPVVIKEVVEPTPDIIMPDAPAVPRTTTDPARLLVQITNTELRDAGPAELMTRLHLSIAEEAVEWTTIESQGQTVSKLLPE